MDAPPRIDVLDVTPDQDLPAGQFGTWLDAMQQALDRAGSMAVPCGPCTACCRSAYFVHIGADETETLAHVPRALRFPAPGSAADQVMGFDADGHCPMLVDDRCSIYAHRPLTCRRYDCRVFSAAGLDPGADDKPDVAAQVRRWRFAHADADERRRHRATAAAARFLLQHGAALGRRLAPANLTQVAVLAVRIEHLFAQHAEHAAAPEPILAAVRAVLAPDDDTVAD